MALKNKNNGNSDCGCDPYLLSLVEPQNPTATNKPNKSIGLVLATLTGGAAIALSVVCFPFVSPALRRVITCVLNSYKYIKTILNFSIRSCFPMFRPQQDK